jgi:hypothetical protein
MFAVSVEGIRGGVQLTPHEGPFCARLNTKRSNDSAPGRR